MLCHFQTPEDYEDCEASNRDSLDMSDTELNEEIENSRDYDENSDANINVDGLADYMSTLVPGLHPHKEPPPSLPPKQRHRNGQAVAVNGGDHSRSTPPSDLPVVPPRRKDKKPITTVSVYKRN